jgi:hypothetical protein
VLRSNFPDRSVVGAVYTPFLRVALAARQAAEQGRRLDVEQLPPSAVEPVIWVRFYYAKHPAAGPDFANMEPSFGIVPAQRISPIGGVSPVWVKPIDAAVLFDAAHTVARKAWVAAFRPADVKPDQDFVMFWSTQSPGGGGTAVQIRGGIRAEDLQAWR